MFAGYPVNVCSAQVSEVVAFVLDAGRRTVDLYMHCIFVLTQAAEVLPTEQVRVADLCCRSLSILISAQARKQALFLVRRLFERATAEFGEHGAGVAANKTLFPMLNRRRSVGSFLQCRSQVQQYRFPVGNPPERRALLERQSCCTERVHIPHRSTWPCLRINQRHTRTSLTEVTATITVAEESVLLIAVVEAARPL